MQVDILIGNSEETEQHQKMQKLSDCAIFHARALCHIAEKYVEKNNFLSSFFPIHDIETIFT